MAIEEIIKEVWWQTQKNFMRVFSYCFVVSVKPFLMKKTKTHFSINELSFDPEEVSMDSDF